ncbi:hypothetical protein GMI70_07020 [Eggerthellaceae bacterium zg-893]|nr:hypothetical protein [Eggerthellaceae bacterium zg-893]
MAAIETVSIDDVYPLTDEYGNDLASRDYSLKENQEYVKELARSMRAKGVPDEMVTLVRDGGIYRIKAGNSRVRAMKLLGTKAFPAVVEDEGGLQDAIETVVRTNTKKKYEAVEESRFVRQLAMFGDDEYVAEVAGMEVEQAAKVRRAAKAVKDAADDMSLLRLIAIGELADDPEAVDALANCKESEYRAVARRFEARRRKEKAAEELAAALEGRGIRIVDEAPGMALVANVNSAAALPDGLPDGCVAMRHSAPGFFMVLAPASEEDGRRRAEEDAARAEAAAVASLFAEGRKRRRAWLAEQIAARRPLAAMAALVRSRANRFTPMVRIFVNETGVDLEVGQAEIVSAFEMESGAAPLDSSGSPILSAFRRYAVLLDAMERDGYEPDEDERLIYQKAHDALEEEK